MEGAKVRLRPIEPEDLDLLYQWENDTSVWKISNTSTPFSKNTLKQYIDSIQDIYSDKQLRLVIEEKKHCLPIGFIDLFDFDPNNRKVGVGILIADKDFEGKGYASDSLKILQNYAFNTLNLHQVYCNILEDNEKSIALFKHHNFTLAGTKKDWVMENGQWKNELVFQCFEVASQQE